MKTSRFMITFVLMLNGVFSIVAEVFPPIHLSMDTSMLREMEGLLLPYGVVESKDAVLGRALLFENQAYFTLDHPHLRRFGAGDFTISLWLKPDIRSKSIPVFLKGETVLSGGILYKQEVEKGGVTLSLREGIPSFVVTGNLSSVEELKEIAKMKKLEGGQEVFDRIWDGDWHHYAITNKGSVYRSFLDGRQLAMWANPRHRDFSNSTSLLVGMDRGYNRAWYTGLLDEMVLDFRAWSREEVEAHYDSLKHADDGKSRGMPLPLRPASMGER